MAVEAWQPNAATGWWLLADQTEDIYWRCWCYWRVVFPVPFKKKAKAVLPSSEAVGVDGLLPKVNSKLPAVSPAINTPTIPSINTPSRRGWDCSSACPRVRGRGDSCCPRPSLSRGKTRYLAPRFRRWIPQKISTRHSTGWLIAAQKSFRGIPSDRQRYARYLADGVLEEHYRYAALPK